MPGPAGPHTSLDPASGFSPSRAHFSHQGHQGHQGHHGTLPRNFTHGHHSLPSHQVVTNGSLIPNNTSLSPAMTHSTPLRPEWEASPVVRLPDWAASSEPRSFPADYGLPVSRRPEVNRAHLKPLTASSLSKSTSSKIYQVHLAHNPLDTLREEEDFPGGTNYTSGAIHALEMLSQVGCK